jgi:glucokinase
VIAPAERVPPDGLAAERPARADPEPGPVVAAVDWGGTWIRVALAGAGGRLLAQVRRRRPEDLADQCAVVADTVASLAADLGARPAAAGVGIAGITRGGVVESAANIGITQPLDLAGRLQAGIGVPVTVVNDTQAAAVAEAGALGDGTHVLITVGTGIGGAIVTAGRLMPGNGAAGDFGHMVVAVDGPPCSCGGRGCLEQLVSGRVLDLAAQRLAATGGSPWLAARAAVPGQPGAGDFDAAARRAARRDVYAGDFNAAARGAARRDVHAGDLDAAARAGDGAARAVLADAASVLAAGLRSITAAVDPEVIVLGGGLLGRRAVLTRLVSDCWHDQRPHWSRAELRPALLGAEAGLRGAALIAARR